MYKYAFICRYFEIRESIRGMCWCLICTYRTIYARTHICMHRRFEAFVTFLFWNNFSSSQQFFRDVQVCFSLIFNFLFLIEVCLQYLNHVSYFVVKMVFLLLCSCCYCCCCYRYNNLFNIPRKKTARKISDLNWKSSFIKWAVVKCRERKEKEEEEEGKKDNVANVVNESEFIFFLFLSENCSSWDVFKIQFG